jgi:hypothetical protein
VIKYNERSNHSINYIHTDWDYFNYLLESNINPSVLLKTADQLEREQRFMTAMQESAWKYTCYQYKAKGS